MKRYIGFNAPSRIRLLCGGAAIILLGFIAIAGYTVFDTWRATQLAAVQSSQNLAGTLAHDIDRNITLYDLSLQTVIAELKQPELWKMTPEMRGDFLFDGSANADDLGALFVLDAHGDVVIQSRTAGFAPENFAERDFFTAQRDRADIGLYISTPYRAPTGSQWAIAFSRRISRPDGSFGGIVFGSIRLDYFRRLFDRVDLGPNGGVNLLRTDGTILMREPFNDATIGHIVPDIERFRSAPTGSFMATGQIDGVRRLIVYQKIGNLPIIVSVAPTTKSIFAQWRRKATITLGLILGLAGTAAWLVFWLVSEVRRRTEAEQRHKHVADAEREARAALERSMAQVEASVREQMRAQRALRESESRFRDFAGSCGDWFWETDADHRYSLYVGNTPTAEKAPPAGAIGKTPWELAKGDPLQDTPWQSHQAALDAHEPFRRFHYSTETDGQWIHYSTSGIPVFNEHGAFTGYRGVTFDVTGAIEGRRRAEEARALLRDAVDSISEGFVIFDADDRFVMCNAAYEKLYAAVMSELRPGVTFEHLLRTHILRRTGESSTANYEDWIDERVRAHRDPPAHPIERRVWDGRWVLVSERRMSDGGMAGLQIDITALKAAQQALHESERRLARAQRIAGIGDVEHEAETGAVTWSEEAFRIYGVSSERVPLWSDFLALIYPDDRARVVAAVDEMRQGRAAPNIEYRIIRPDGSVRHLLRENEPVRDAMGKVVRVASTVQDITELRESQERERELHTQLQHRQKIEALGTLAGGIAHDMNNTLVPILALSKRAMTQAPTDSRERENLEIVYHAAGHARDLVKQILAFSRKETVDKKPIRLGPIAHDALHMMRAGLPTTIALIERIDDLPIVQGDDGQIRQVIINLVTNAAQAIGEGAGTITMRVEKTGNQVHLSVGDTGCGIDDKHLPRLFDPFFTTKEAGQGTGLGLSVVHGIVTAHNGRIDVHSVRGQGSQFTVTLPAISEAELAAASAA